MTEADPALRQSVSAALRALAGRNPAEVTRFLREQATRPDHNTHFIVRAVLRALPEEAQAEVIRALRA
jgi:hypothetical protein